MALLPRRLIALVVLSPACLLLTALPASAATKTLLHYTGGLTGTAVLDESGSGSDGTAHDITSSGGAYSFNGISSYIQTPASSAVNPGYSDFSYSVSINLPTTDVFSRDYSLVRRGSSSLAGPYYKMEMVYDQSTGHMQLTCALRDTAEEHATVSAGVDTLNDGQWHTLTCAKTAKTISLTVDGHVHTTRAKLRNMTSTEPLNFGADQVGPSTFVENFPGLMDEIVLTKH